MKKSMITLSKLIAFVFAISLILPAVGCGSEKPANNNGATDSSQTVKGENTFIEKGMPLADDEELLTDRSFRQLMYDVDGDGADDRITCATLDKEEDDALLCIQFADGTTPDAKLYLCDGYTHPDVFAGRYEDMTLIYVSGESQGSGGEQMVHPFVYDGTLRAVINPDAEYMTETSVYCLPCFTDPFECEYDGAGLLTVHSGYAPDLYITLPDKLINHKYFDEDYGMHINTQDCTMTVDTDENTVTVNFACAVQDTEKISLSVAEPVTLNAVLAFDGETFTVRAWKYEADDGIQWSMDGDIPAPSQTPYEDKKAYAGTVTLKSSSGATVTGKADLDGDGTQERMEIVTDDNYDSRLAIYSSDGKLIYEQSGEFLELYAADLTADGRRCILVQRSEESIGEIKAFFLKDGKLKQIKADIPDSYENTVYGYIEGIYDGVITFEFSFDLMGTRMWRHDAYLDGNTLRLTDEDYLYRNYSDSYYTLKQDTTAYNTNDEMVTVLKGYRLTPYSSDMKTYIWYTDESGNKLRMDIEFRKDAWAYNINGVFQDDLFDGIGYAG